MQQASTFFWTRIPLCRKTVWKMHPFFKEQPGAGALGIRMIDGRPVLERKQRAFPSPLTSLYKLSGLAKLFPHSKTFARVSPRSPAAKHHAWSGCAGRCIHVYSQGFKGSGQFDETFLCMVRMLTWVTGFKSRLPEFFILQTAPLFILRRKHQERQP